MVSDTIISYYFELAKKVSDPFFMRDAGSLPGTATDDPRAPYVD